MATMTGCWASQPDPSNPQGSGAGTDAYVAVAPSDDALRLAVAQGVTLLRGDGWLAAPGLMAREPLTAERLVGDGTRYRVTLPIVNETRRRIAQLTVVHDPMRTYHLQAAEFGPVGSDAPLPAIPEASVGLPGGWQDQAADQATVTEAVASARQALVGADWLKQPVVVERVVTARTQVVAGTNVYVAFEGRVKQAPRRVHVRVFQPLQGPNELEWVRLEVL
ncbi:MAG: hypothetical protein ACK46X_01515 [Candidatus Sericytochromatia bacterium]